MIAERTRANQEFFASESARLTAVCEEMAGRFMRGGRLLAAGDDASDARHVAVEFVHPVIVGKRALPALALPALELEAEPDDIVVVFEDGGVTVCGSAFDPPSVDPFVRQELVETLYHVLWELVHVFLEHLERTESGAGAASFLYPFLGGSSDLAAVRDDVRTSIEAKADEIGALRERVLAENEGVLHAAAASLGGRVLALGNGGSATDAQDFTADLRARGRRALDLTDDPAILTAIANDIGVEAIFARQVIAHGRTGDTLVTFSTSGSSTNVLAALAEARRRGMGTVAFVGYDGGQIAAESLADHTIVIPSEHIPRIQEAQATAYHTLIELAAPTPRATAPTRVTEGRA